MSQSNDDPRRSSAGAYFVRAATWTTAWAFIATCFFAAWFCLVQYLLIFAFVAGLAVGACESITLVISANRLAVVVYDLEKVEPRVIQFSRIAFEYGLVSIPAAAAFFLMRALILNERWRFNTAHDRVLLQLRRKSRLDAVDPIVRAACFSLEPVLLLLIATILTSSLSWALVLFSAAIALLYIVKLFRIKDALAHGDIGFRWMPDLGVQSPAECAVSLALKHDPVARSRLSHVRRKALLSNIPLAASLLSAFIGFLILSQTDLGWRAIWKVFGKFLGGALDAMSPPNAWLQLVATGTTLLSVCLGSPFGTRVFGRLINRKRWFRDNPCFSCFWFEPRAKETPDAFITNGQVRASLVGDDSISTLLEADSSSTLLGEFSVDSHDPECGEVWVGRRSLRIPEAVYRESDGGIWIGSLKQGPPDAIFKDGMVWIGSSADGFPQGRYSGHGGPAAAALLLLLTKVDMKSLTEAGTPMGA